MTSRDAGGNRFKNVHLEYFETKSRFRSISRSLSLELRSLIFKRIDLILKDIERRLIEI